MTGMLKQLARNLLPDSAKKRLHDFRCHRYYSRKLKRLQAGSGGGRIILMGTPEYGNLGDHAIAAAELQFFHDHCPDYNVIEITGTHYRFQKDQIARYVAESDVICITGGGFYGSLWMMEEMMVRDILSTFTENRIIILPSTIFFEDSETGRREQQNSRRIYRRHRDVTLCVRDAQSMDTARQLIGEDKEDKLVFLPDMALYLDKADESVPREGILFCLREDKEKILPDPERDRMLDEVARIKRKISFTTTVLPQSIRVEERSLALEKIYCEFRRAELVITDRLHGMIFAVITGTPCIALDNSSGKVQGVYPWVEDLGYVHFADSPLDVGHLAGRMLGSHKETKRFERVNDFRALADLFRPSHPKETLPEGCLSG